MSTFIIRFASIILLFAVISCTKNSDSLFTSTNPELTVATAKIWFETNSLYNSNARLKKTRFSDLTPDWKMAKSGKTRIDDKFIEIPLKASGRFKTLYSEISNGQSKKKLVESTNLWLVIYSKNGLIRESIKEIRPNSAYALSHNGNINVSDFTGEIFTWDWSTNLTGGSFYKDGIRLGTIKSTSSDKNGREYYCNTYTSCYWSSYCTDNYGQITVYGTTTVGFNGQCGTYEGAHGNTDDQSCSGWYVTDTDSYQQCYDNGDQNDPGQGTGPGGYSTNRDVDNQVVNPCVRGQVDAIINADVKSYIQIVFNAVFNNVKGVNLLTFAENNSMGPSARTVVSSSNPLTLTTYLNTDIMGSASKEYTTMTIYHEIVHAILDNDGSTFNQFDQHVDMTQNYIDRLVDATRSLYPDLDKRDAQALALFGLGEVFQRSPNTYEQVANRYGLSIAEISSIGTAFRRDTNQKKGTPCN